MTIRKLGNAGWFLSWRNWTMVVNWKMKPRFSFELDWLTKKTIAANPTYYNRSAPFFQASLWLWVVSVMYLR